MKRSLSKKKKLYIENSQKINELLTLQLVQKVKKLHKKLDSLLKKSKKKKYIILKEKDKPVMKNYKTHENSHDKKDNHNYDYKNNYDNNYDYNNNYDYEYNYDNKTKTPKKTYSTLKSTKKDLSSLFTTGTVNKQKSVINSTPGAASILRSTKSKSDFVPSSLFTNKKLNTPGAASILRSMKSTSKFIPNSISKQYSKELQSRFVPGSVYVQKQLPIGLSFSKRSPIKSSPIKSSPVKLSPSK